MITNAKILAKAVNPVEYHEAKFERGDLRLEMSSSQLREFYRCPQRWKEGYNSPASESKTWGSLVDTLLLTPEQFSKRYVVTPQSYTTKAMECPRCNSITDSKSCRQCKCERVEIEVSKPWTLQSDTCLEMKKEWEAQGLELLSASEKLAADAAIAKLMRDSHIATYVNESDKQVWVAATWEDESGLKIPVKALLDLVPRADSVFGKSAGDLKTTRSAALGQWQRWVYSAGYHIQGALMLDLLSAALPNDDRNTWCHILSENFAPYQTGKRILSHAYIELGRAEYKKMLRLYCQCLKIGKWPHYDDHDEAVQGWTIVEPSPWMESESLFEVNPLVEPEESPDENIDIIP